MNQNQHSLPVRMITAGSVDDGKSTLIGRLLYDCQAVLTDQLQTLAKARHARVLADDAAIDLSLLTDGLLSEREQGITIDVAYRYFTTTTRKFILADAPGHEQYTRNLVTGASQSDVAVILVDATRINTAQSPINLLPQTKRHSSIIKLMGLPHIIFAVNKMDLLDYAPEPFRAIESALIDLAHTLGLPTPHIIPMSALKGEGVVRAHRQMAWYQGPTLLSLLESLKIEPQQDQQPLRLAVQWVLREDGAQSVDLRSYLGKVAVGVLRVGQKVRILPEGERSTIKAIYTPGARESADSADAGTAVAIELTDDVDVSRGHLIVADDEPAPMVSKRLMADVCWLDREALNPSRKYVFRINTREVMAKVAHIHRVLDIETLSHSADHNGMGMNAIGELEINLQNAVAAESFSQCRPTGAFVLIDPVSQHTVAAGMVRQVY